jgi:hypothetical protein
LRNTKLDVVISEIYFGNETIYFGQFSVHQEEVLTVHSAMVYVITGLWTAFEQDQDPGELHKEVLQNCTFFFQ